MLELFLSMPQRFKVMETNKLKQTQESPTINSTCCLTSTHANSSLELSPSLAKPRNADHHACTQVPSIIFILLATTTYFSSSPSNVFNLPNTINVLSPSPPWMQQLEDLNFTLFNTQ